MVVEFYPALKRLCEIAAPSGAENTLRTWLIGTLRAHVDTMKIDRMGNLICTKKGQRKPKVPILLCAHMDEVGFMVSDITAQGHLKFQTVGGVESAILPAKRLRFVGDKADLAAIVCAKPIHLYRDAEELYQPTKLETLYLDIGAKDRDDAKAHVEIGDLLTFDREYLPYLETQTHIRSAALDDRLGCAMLCELLQGTPEYDITVAFTVKEESGLRGAKVLPASVDFERAIILEGTTASDLPDAKGADAVCFQGQGGVLSLFDAATLYDRNFVRGAQKALETAAIPVQFKRRLAGGNDAGALSRVAGAKKVLSFSAPCRYLHSPATTVCKQDLDDMRRALSHLIRVAATF